VEMGPRPEIQSGLLMGIIACRGMKSEATDDKVLVIESR